MVIMYSKSTAHIGSNGSHFLTLWSDMDSNFGYGRTKWMFTIYSKYTAHIGSNASHFLTARFFVYWPYEVSKFWYGHRKFMVRMYSKYTAHMRRTSQNVKKAKKVGFLPSILWVFLTIYIFFALMKSSMFLKHLEASHIMSCDSWY